MKCLLCICLAFVCTGGLYAQNLKIDSVNKLIAHAASDTARINQVNVKAKLYSEVNLDSAIALVRHNIAEANRIGYLKGESDAHRGLGVYLSFKGLFGEALRHLQMAEKQVKQLHDAFGLYRLHTAWGVYYGLQSKYDSSVWGYKKAVDYLEKTANKAELPAVYQNIAVSYTMLSNYRQAIFYQNKALRLAEEANNLSSLAYLHVNMGISYANMMDYTRAEQLYKKAIEYGQRAQLKNVLLYATANLASIYYTVKQYDTSYRYAMQAVALAGQLGDNAMEATSLSRAGMALIMQKKYPEAGSLIRRGVWMADSMGMPLNRMQTKAAMGFLLKEQGDYKNAIQYYEQAFAAMKDADMYDSQIGEFYNQLSEVYEKTGAYDKALAAFKTAVKISDSIQSRENIRRVTEQNMNYAFAKKEQAAAALQDRKDALSASRQTALLVSLACALLLIAGGVYAYRNKQRSNVQLFSQKKEIEATLAELKATQAQLIQSEKMASLGELTAGIAHEIQNPLNFVNNFSEVSIELIDEMEEETAGSSATAMAAVKNEIKSNLEKILHHGRRADAIVKGMLLHSRTGSGIKELTDINALADEYLRLSYHGLRAKDKTFHARMQTHFDPAIPIIRVMPQDIGRVLLNLFTNACYAVHQKQLRLAHTGYEPQVSVTTCLKDAEVEIRIKDNGDGIPEAIRAKIFQPFFTTKPTGKGTGLGLSLSYDMVVKGHGGSLKVCSQEGDYAEFVIILPV